MEQSELSEVNSRTSRWQQRSMCALFLLASLWLVSNNVADPDLWGHVQYGRDVIRDATIHPTTTYSFTANGYRWINHENLSEILLAVAVDSFGTAGLAALKFLLAAGVFLMMLYCGMKHGLSSASAGLLVLVVAANLAFHWHFRPQLMSFFFCAVMLAILEFSFRGWQEHYLKRPDELSAEDSTKQHKFNTRRVRLLWLMPVVLCLWANSHGGFVAGLCIYIAYLAGRTIEAFYYRGSRAWGIARRFTMMAFVGLLGTLLNPYGPDLHLWLLNSLGQPRPEISDWLGTSIGSAEFTRLLMTAAFAAIALIFTKRKRDWTHIVIMSLVLWQSVEHVRHIPFFALLMGFWTAPHFASMLQQAVQRLSKQDVTAPSPTRDPVRIVLHAAGIVLLVVLCGWRLSDVSVAKNDYPVEAFQYIADQQLDGRMVITYNWAQYAIGTFGGHSAALPHCPVAFDGRFRTCYPQEIVDMHFDFVIGDQGPGMRHRSPASPPLDETRVLKYGSPELVVISRRQHPSIEVMNKQTNDWILLYQDEIAQVWGLKSRFDNPDSGDYVAVEDRKITDLPQVGSVTWPALPAVNPPTINPPTQNSAITEQVAVTANRHSSRDSRPAVRNEQSLTTQITVD